MLKDFVCNLYAFSWRLQEKIMQNHAYRTKKTIVWWKKSWLWMPVLPLVFLVFAGWIGSNFPKISLVLIMLAFLSLLMSGFVAINSDFLYSLTHFLSLDGKPGFVKYVVAILGLTFLALLFVIVVAMDLGFLRDNRSIFILFLLIVLILVLLYMCLVLLANARVSTMVNDLLSISILVILEVKNVIFSILPFLPIEEKVGTLPNHVTLFWSDMVNVVFYIYFVPLLLLFASGSFLAHGKKYWIERYNDGRDIEYLLPNTDKI